MSTFEIPPAALGLAAALVIGLLIGLERAGRVAGLLLAVAYSNAAFGFLNPMIAGAAMALSSLSATINSALLKRIKLDQG